MRQCPITRGIVPSCFAAFSGRSNPFAIRVISCLPTQPTSWDAQQRRPLASPDVGWCANCSQPDGVDVSRRVRGGASEEPVTALTASGPCWIRMKTEILSLTETPAATIPSPRPSTRSLRHSHCLFCLHQSRPSRRWANVSIRETANDRGRDAECVPCANRGIARVCRCGTGFDCRVGERWGRVLAPG